MVTKALNLNCACSEGKSGTLKDPGRHSYSSTCTSDTQKVIRATTIV